MLGGILLILSSHNHPKARAIAASVGCVVTVIAIGVLAVSAGNAVIDPQNPSTLSGVIDLTLGGILILFGVWRFFHMPRRKQKPKARTPSPKPQMLKYVGVGFLLTVTNSTSLAALLTAAKLTVDSGLEAAQQTAAMGVAMLYFTIPFLGPLLLSAVAPDVSARYLSALDSFIRKYGRYILGVILILIGIYLGRKGLDNPALR